MLIVEGTAPPTSRKLTDEALSFSSVDLSAPVARMTDDPLNMAFRLRIAGTAGVDNKGQNGRTFDSVVFQQHGHGCVAVTGLYFSLNLSRHSWNKLPTNLTCQRRALANENTNDSSNNGKALNQHDDGDGGNAWQAKKIGYHPSDLLHLSWS